MKSAALIAVVLALVSAGCKDQQVKLASNSGLGEARAYKRFPVYYAGDKVIDLPLTARNLGGVQVATGAKHHHV